MEGESGKEALRRPWRDLAESARRLRVLVPRAEAGAQVGGEGGGRSGRAFRTEKGLCMDEGRSGAGCLLELVLGSSQGPTGRIPTRAGPGARCKACMQSRFILRPCRGHVCVGG